MKARDVVGVSRVVLGRRERAVILEARGDGIIVWTLRFGDEVRAEGDYFDGTYKPAQAEAEAHCRQKKATKPPHGSGTESKKDNDQKSSNVVDIMDALRKSVQKELRVKADR